MAFVRAYMVGKIHCNHIYFGGFSESYPLNTLDYATGKTLLTKIVNYRRALLSEDIDVVHAYVSRTDREDDSARVAGLPLDHIELAGEEPIEECHTPESGFLYRFDSGSGKYRNLLIRGLRDKWIEKQRKQIAGGDYLSVFAPEPALPDGTTTPSNALIAFLKVVAANCPIFVPGNYQFDPPPAEPEPGFDVLDIARVQFTKIGSRDVGRGFSRGRRRRKKTI